MIGDLVRLYAESSMILSFLYCSRQAVQHKTRVDTLKLVERHREIFSFTFIFHAKRNFISRNLFTELDFERELRFFLNIYSFDTVRRATMHLISFFFHVFLNEITLNPRLSTRSAIRKLNNAFREDEFYFECEQIK